MTRERTLAERVAAVDAIPVRGIFMRHAAPGRDAFAGGTAGRWGRAFPVIYLGRPTESCVEEAYRHLVDETGVPAHLVKARALYRVRVEAEKVLDLRDEVTQRRLGLSTGDLISPVGEYERCQQIAAVAHQLEFHGVIAPAATALGETLALFRQRISMTEFPVVIEQELWESLPQRPGGRPARLAIVRD